MTICRTPGCTEHYACSLRAKGLQVSPAATPTRRNKLGTQVPQRNSWERGVAGERRADGSFMPLLNHHQEPIRAKEAAERRHEITEQVTRLKSDPNVFQPERT